MPSYFIISFALSYLISVATAIPASSYYDGNGGYHLVYPSNYPTCGNDGSMYPFSTTITVKTQPDCDDTIETICRAAAKQGGRNLGHANNTCEGHIIFASTTSTVKYDDCVSSFQSITETCILMGGPKNYAAVNKQYGVKNLQYFADATAYPQGEVATWSAGSADPGYLMGPPHVFGDDFHAIDANDVLTR